MTDEKNSTAPREVLKGSSKADTHADAADTGMSRGRVLRRD